MGNKSDSVTPSLSDDESGESFTDGDFGDTDDDFLECVDDHKIGNIPVNESINTEVNMTNDTLLDSTETSADEGRSVDEVRVNGAKRSKGAELRRDSHGDNNPSIVGIIGNQHNYAEQRLAARRAARAEAREIRMRELERQQREQEDHADKAYDMYNGTPRVEALGRRTSGRLSALPAALAPRRASEDSNEEPLNTKELRHELKEVEEKFRQAMILNAQLDNDKAALGYQLELLKDRLEELQQQFAQLQREHKEKCSSHERLKRDNVSLERDLSAARAGVAAREAAAAAAGRAFAACAADHVPGFGPLPPLALVPLEADQALADHGDGTLDVRLQNLINSKQALESEVRKLKLQLNDERAARQNGVANHHDQEYENELESLRKCAAEAKARAARAEAEAALQAAAAARLDTQLTRLRARVAAMDDAETQLKTDRRRLQREAREALNRVEELETENSHLTKRLDKLKNAKSALLKEL